MNNKALVVVLFYNGKAYIDDCLNSLRNAELSSLGCSVLCIDNASTDGTADEIARRYPEFQLIRLEQNIGFADGNNRGFQYAEQHGYEFVYLLNQDTASAPDFLSTALSTAEHDPAIGAVQSKLMLYDQRDTINSIGNVIHYLGFGYTQGYKQKDFQPSAREVAYPSGACTLYRVSALRQTGHFWPDFFMYHEDTDLGWRLWIAGWRCVLAPESVVYHKYEFSRSIKKFYFMERNRHLVLLQNYKLATIIAILPALIIMDASMLVYSLYGGWFKEYVRGVWSAFRPASWSQIVRRRNIVQKTRALNDQEIIKRFTGIIEFQEIENPLLRYVVNPFFGAYWNIVRRIIRW